MLYWLFAIVSIELPAVN